MLKQLILAFKNQNSSSSIIVIICYNYRGERVLQTSSLSHDTDTIKPTAEDQIYEVCDTKDYETRDQLYY